jgi:hypothetical protein
VNSTSQRVGQVIATVLPNGTVPEEYWRQYQAKRSGLALDDESAMYALPPAVPTDLFAAVGYLARVSGLVAFFDPSPYCRDRRHCRFFLGIDDRRALDRVAEKWRDSRRGAPPREVRDIWDVLRAAWDEPITSGSYLQNGGEAPDWWIATFKLVMLADMALNRLLRDPLSSEKYGGAVWEDVIRTMYRRPPREDGSPEPPPASLTYLADSSVACVLPKVRVAPVGATLRNVTRNLSLLPGRGEVRCYWDLSVEAPPSEDRETLDILLIPAPVSLSGRDFVPNVEDGCSSRELHTYKKNWESFDLKQNWIADEETRASFIRDCCRLVSEAKRESGCVNGVVLPEYALDWQLFELLCDQLKQHEPKLEFVISGSSNNCYETNGNHVLTRVWYDNAAPSKHITNSRGKHHRWRMDRSQVETYALSAALNPKIRNWWENTPLGRREIHFQRFRQKSVFSVLICEELARSDPCHEILRAVAPNLIFTLLLDGPQIRNRWPAQYASNLADDPGSSVLTFTSYGLIDRSNRQGRYPANHSIAMWKDDGGHFLEIPMPAGKGMRGVLLSLWSEHVVDMTIVGKQSEARAWRYSSHYPIRLPGA